MKKNDGNQRKQKQKLESYSDETKAKIYAKKENELKNSTKYIKDINIIFQYVEKPDVADI